MTNAEKESALNECNRQQEMFFQRLMDLSRNLEHTMETIRLIQSQLGQVERRRAEIESGAQPRGESLAWYVDADLSPDYLAGEMSWGHH